MMNVNRFLRGAGVGCVAVLLAPLVIGPGCVNGKLTPMGEGALLAGFTIACPFEAAIPVVGAGFAAACPGEIAGMRAALDGVTAAAAQPVRASNAKPVVRLAADGRAVHVGWAHEDAAPVVQWAMLRPARAPAVLPNLDAGGDR